MTLLFFFAPHRHLVLRQCLGCRRGGKRSHYPYTPRRSPRLSYRVGRLPFNTARRRSTLSDKNLMSDVECPPPVVVETAAAPVDEPTAPAEAPAAPPAQDAAAGVVAESAPAAPVAGQQQQQTRTSAAKEDPTNKVFVRDIPNAATEEEIKELFSRAGDIVDLLVRDVRDKPFKYAFVGYATQEEATTALGLNGLELAGSAVKVEAKQSRVCFKCNKPGHLAAKCREVEKTCRTCGRPGHMARDCRQQQQVGNRGGFRDRRDAPVRRDDRDYRDDRDDRRRGRDRSRSRSRSYHRRDRSRSRDRSRRRYRSDSREDRKRRDDDRDGKKRRL